MGGGTFTSQSGEIYKTRDLTFDWAENKVNAVHQGPFQQGQWLETKGSLGEVTQGSFYWDAGAGTLYVWQNGGGDPTGNVRLYDARPGFEAVVFVRADGSDYRFLAHHWSSEAGGFFSLPSPQISPDGRLVMWRSNMNNSGRRDILVAEVP